MAGRFSVEAVFKAVDRVTAPVSRMQNRVGKFTRGMEAGLRRANKALSKVVGGLKQGAKTAIKFGAVGLGSITAAVGLLIKEFSKVENAQAAFTPLLGGAEKAKLAVEAINETAASTPFQFETLASSVNQLLPVMNGNIENTIKTLRMLGDTAGGNAQKLDSITRGFTKAMLKGKVDMESLNMIAEAGVPIFGDLADVMGVEVNAAFFKMISAGKVTTQQLTKAFEKMTNKGGKFFKGMDIASKTTTGLWSTLKDNVSLTAAELGSVLAPVVKDLIKGATDMAKKVREWVKNNRELISSKFLEFVNGIKDGIANLVETMRTMNNESNIMERLKTIIIGISDAFEFLKELGSVLAPVVKDLIKGATDMAKKVREWVKNNRELISSKFLEFVNGIKDGIANLVETMRTMNNESNIMERLKTIIIGISDAFEFLKEHGATIAKIIAGIVALSVAVKVASIAMAAFNLIMMANPFVLAAVGIAGVIVFVDELLEAFDKLPAVIQFALAPLKLLLKAIQFVKDGLGSIGGAIIEFFGGGSDDDEKEVAVVQPQVISPQDRTARSIEEQRTTSTAEVTIRDESGRAEVTGGKLGAGLNLQQTGAF